jgi:hypothetical protein
MLIILSVVTILLGSFGVWYTYCKTLDDIPSVYKVDPFASIGDEVLNAEYDEKLVIANNTTVYLMNTDNALPIGTLAEGDVVTHLGTSTNGWQKIIYESEDAYVKSIELMANDSPRYEEVNEHLYIVPEHITVLSVDKSFPTSTELIIQTEVDRIAIGDNGLSKILYNNTEYYIQSEYLSIDKPVIWTDVVEETIRLVSEFDGIRVTDWCKEDSAVLAELNWFDEIKIVANGDNGWSKIVCGDNVEGYIKTDTVVEDIFPIVYEDETCKITIYKEWYKKAWCYAAHLEFADYARLSTDCANGKYGGGYETTPHAAERLNALFAVNGCYSAPYLGYTVVRGGTICNGGGRAMNLPGVYSANTGLFLCAWDEGGASGIYGYNVSSLVKAGKVTDTFCFGPPSLVNGYLKGGNGGARAQRTMMGTNGDPGDLWIVVSDGRYNDGESAGLTFYEGAQYLKEKGCTFGIHLDGGGSSTMYFNGLVLNAVRGNERAVVDFVYFK